MSLDVAGLGSNPIRSDFSGKIPKGFQRRFVRSHFFGQTDAGSACEVIFFQVGNTR